MPTVLEISGRDSAFLRRVFESAQEFVREELRDAPTTSISWLQKEDEAFEVLLDALDTGLVEPNLNAQIVLADLIECVDGDNEYKRIVEEHEALMRLLRQMPEVRVF